MQQHQRKIIYLIGFIFSLSVALMSYLNSSFLSQFIGEKLVGVAYALGSIASILALVVSPQIFRRLGGYKFLLWVTALDALSVLAFAFSKNTFSAVLVFVLGFALNTLVTFSLDELLKIFSDEVDTGKTRGIYLTVSNFAWIVSQILYGSFLGSMSFKTIYLVAFAVMALLLIISYLYLKNIPDPTYDQEKIFMYIKEFFRNKNLARAYFISFLLQLFYCWMIIYTPIYLYLHLKFTWEQIGSIFTVMLLPFILVPFQLGKYSDKIGERKILMLGFLIATLATLSIFFIRTQTVFIWAFVLFMTRCGAATIEVMSDTYFFKHINSENDEFVGVYRSASPVAYIIGPLAAFILFLYLPAFNYLYLILGATMLFGVYLSSTIEKTDS